MTLFLDGELADRRNSLLQYFLLTYHVYKHSKARLFLQDSIEIFVHSYKRAWARGNIYSRFFAIEILFSPTKILTGLASIDISLTRD